MGVGTGGQAKAPPPPLPPPPHTLFFTVGVVMGVAGNSPSTLKLLPTPMNTMECFGRIKWVATLDLTLFTFCYGQQHFMYPVLVNCLWWPGQDSPPACLGLNYNRIHGPSDMYHDLPNMKLGNIRFDSIHVLLWTTALHVHNDTYLHDHYYGTRHFE